MSVGRNDPCPCGSGKKRKKCCGAGPAAPAAKSETASWFQRAQQHLKAGRYQEAVEQYHRILENNPGHANALHYLGLANFWLGNTDQGLTDVERSVRLHPADPVFLNNVAMLYEELGRLQEAETHFQRALNLKPDYLQALRSLAHLLWRRNKIYLAGSHLKDLLRRDPEDIESRALLAEVHGALGDIASMQREFRAVLEKEPTNVAACIRFAELLSRSGRSDEAIQVCEAQLALQASAPDVRVLCTLAVIEERRNRLDEAEQWLRQALQLNPKGPAIRRLMAIVCRRHGRLEEAHTWLLGVDVINLPLDEQSSYGFALGDILDKEHRYAEAYAAYRQGNEACKQILEQRHAQRFYSPERIVRQYAELKRYFSRERVAALEAFSPAPTGGPEPVFIVGFPRSGTTLVEQMLAAHPAVHAGDELNALHLLRISSATRLASSVEYPDCLSDVRDPLKQRAFYDFRDYYLGHARDVGAVNPERKLFTDKMPLNEEHLGLIHLVFPRSPIVHLIRHPLDVVWSCYSNELLHGYNCALDLETVAFHYVLVLDLVEHYCSQIDMQYTRVHYEKVVADPENELRRLLDFMQQPWNPAVLEFHRSQRVARTASYAQVSQKLYSSSIGRWRHYREQLSPAITILAPTIERLGYAID